MISSSEAYLIVKELRNWEKAADNAIDELDSKIREYAQGGDVDIEFKIDKTKDIYHYFNSNSMAKVTTELETNGYIVKANPVTMTLNISWDEDNLSQAVGN